MPIRTLAPADTPAAIALAPTPPAASTNPPRLPPAGQQPTDRRDVGSIPSAVPGLALCLAAGAAVVGVHALVPALSPLLLAIVLGMALANLVTMPATTAPGVAIAAKRLLRIGIVLLGLQLSLRDIAGLGAGVAGIVVAVVGGGILATIAWGRLLGIASLPRLLIACGFSICGAAAVAALDGVVDADDEDVATSIALVVLFGTLMIPLVPLLGAVAGFDTQGRAILAGASIHEVAQVVAASGVIGSGALATAVLVKLARVLLLAPVMAAVSIWQRRQPQAVAGKRPPIVPLFLAGFVAAVLLRTFVALPAPVQSAGTLSETFLLATAMFALGLGVRVSALRRVGARPIVLGVLSTMTVVTIAAVGVWLTGA